jgi:hypothetical protein
MAAKLAIQSGHKPSAEAALAALIRLLPKVQKLVEVWR